MFYLQGERMSNFIVPVVLIDAIEPIDGADFIELVKIGEYRSVVRKGLFKENDKVVYIPEASIVPDNIIESLGLTGKLSGSAKNRVKAIKLKSTLSQGLIMSAKEEWNVGDNMQEELGISKWEPPIPESLNGKVCSANQEYTMVYDIENFKYFPDLIEQDEPVVISEKLHGVCCFMTLLSENILFEKEIFDTIVIDPGGYDETTGVKIYPITEKLIKGVEKIDYFAASKGLSKLGLVFDVYSNKDNAYIKAATKYNVFEKMKNSILIKKHMNSYKETKGKDCVFHLLGEVLCSIQDLVYSNVTGDLQFRVFDAFVGLRSGGRFLNDDELEELLLELDLPRVPVLYKGPFSKEKLYELTEGKEMVSGKNLHIREGVVVRPLVERTSKGSISYSEKFDRGLKFDGIFDRVQLKNVSASYLTRKNATEFT